MFQNLFQKVVRDAPQVETMLGVRYRINPTRTLEDLMERAFTHFGILVSTEVENRTAERNATKTIYLR